MSNESQNKEVAALQPIVKQVAIDVIIDEIHQLLQSIRKTREDLKKRNII